MIDAGEKYVEDIIMRIQDHQEELSWEISQLEEGIDGYLPISWLEVHNPDVNWTTGQMTWRSDHCKKHCLPVDIRRAVKAFVQLIEESKVWEVACGTTWHNSEGGDI